MKIKSLILSIVCFGQMVGLAQEKYEVIQLPQAESCKGLAEQLSNFHNQEMMNKVLTHEQSFNGVLSQLQKDEVATITDFEKSVSRWLKAIDGARSYDQFTAWIRLLAYIKGFLKVIYKYGDQLENKDAIFFNTSILDWENYKNFPIQDNDALREIAFEIVENIQEKYSTN